MRAMALDWTELVRKRRGYPAYSMHNITVSSVIVSEEEMPEMEVYSYEREEIYDPTAEYDVEPLRGCIQYLLCSKDTKTICSLWRYTRFRKHSNTNTRCFTPPTNWVYVRRSTT